MARGWESKSVEQQQDEAQSANNSNPFLTPEQKQVHVRKQGLMLSRSRILQQINAASNPAYRKTLEQALADIEDQINRLP